MTSCLLLHPCISRLSNANYRSSYSELIELKLLAKSISLKIISSKIVNLSKINVSHFFGKGKISELKFILDNLEEKNCLLIINSTLTRIQQRNLERMLNKKILDRTA